MAVPTNEPQQTHHPRQPIFDDQRPDFHNEGLDDYERGVTDCTYGVNELFVPVQNKPTELTSSEIHQLS